MAILKIDSNITGLRYAEEKSIGVLPASPVWHPLEPNEYTDFGGQLTTIARNPINPSRQRKKGVVADLEASGGFSTDITQTNMQDLLQGFFFADIRKKTEFGGAGEITNIDGSGNDFEAASGLDAFSVGDLVFASGTANNNGLHYVTAVAATSLTVDSNLVTEDPANGAKLVRVGVRATADDLGVDVSGTFPAITSTTLDFTTLGLTPGEWVFVGGDSTGSSFVQVTMINGVNVTVNNGWKRVRKIAENTLTFDKSDHAMKAEALSGGEKVEIYLPRTIKNETGGLVKRRTYQLERTLGKADATHAEDQREYLTGSVPSEFNLSIPTAEKLTAELNFVSTDNEQFLGTDAKKGGSRPDLVESDAFNTSSDMSRVKLAEVIDGEEAPTPLFAFATEINLSVNNNVSANKAIGVLGAFEVTAGTFQVSGDMTVYLSSVAAVQAVRQNRDITFDIAIWKDNAGIVIDVPLLTLGDGRASVEQDQPITLSVSMDAATAAKIDPNLDYTLLISFFDYLPDAADG